jgi:DNA repair exonuclease SbcCD ATPase subunit
MKDNISSTIALIKDSKPAENRFAEQLYYSAGLGPEIEEGIREYDQHMQGENKLLNKVLGTRGSDIRGYGEAVAKKVAVAVYNQLSQQYGGKVGDLRSYIMTLEEERDRANQRYDDLMGRAIGILGEEYKELRTDSKEFMEKLTNVMGEDLKASRINSEEITEKLADIDGLRSEIRTLSRDKEQMADEFTKEKDQLKQRYESQIAANNNEHKMELANLEERYESQIAAINNEHKVEIRNFSEKHESQTTETGNQHKAEIKDLNLQMDALAKEKDLLADTSMKEKEQQKERFEQQMTETENQHKAELKELNLRIEAMAKEKELLANKSAGEKEQQKERFEQQIAAIHNDYKVEIRNLTEKYESQMAEANNEHKAELRKLNSRVEILTKEKELQKEQYESQIAELDSTALGDKSSESADNTEPMSDQVALEAVSQA